MTNTEPCKLLPWDSEFFGYRIARARENHMHEDLLREILEWCSRNTIDCLYLLADSDHVATVALAEDNRFRLVDIRVALECRTGNRRPAQFCDCSPDSFSVRQSQEGDISRLEAIAHEIHTGTRFFNDPRFSEESCKALYAMWIRRSCEGYADMVFVAEEDNVPVGYVSCHVGEKDNGSIGLIGVSPKAREHGIGKALVEHSLQWFNDRSVERMSIVTQGSNVSGQRLYQHCGFVTQSVQLWYHKWFSDC